VVGHGRALMLGRIEAILPLETEQCATPSIGSKPAREREVRLGSRGIQELQGHRAQVNLGIVLARKILLEGATMNRRIHIRPVKARDVTNLDTSPSSMRCSENF
jgi:hypothetical protein